MPSTTTLSRPKRILLFISTIFFGFLLFALPNLFFGITKFNGGLSGINLALIALFQFVTVLGLIGFSIKKNNWTWRNIGFNGFNKLHIGYGLLTALVWLSIQFIWLIPSTGGESRADIQQMVAMMDDSILTLVSFLVLGVVGGGITEEFYNRGYFIKGMQDLFNNQKAGLLIASLSSIVFFALGHLPHDLISWIDIMVPTIFYTLLFISTGSLTSSIVAHSMYNAAAILLVYTTYYL